MFLITGCGRSGTLYIARSLQQAGIDVGHEYLGTDGAVSSVWTAPSPPYPKFHQQGPRPQFDWIFHQVRHPLNNIASVMTSSSWDFVARWIPINLDWLVLKRSAHYWYWWNRLAEDQACMTYRIENLEDEWTYIMAILGYEIRYDVATTSIPKDTNHREHNDISWDDLSRAAPEMFPRIVDMADRYGYMKE